MRRCLSLSIFLSNLLLLAAISSGADDLARFQSCLTAADVQRITGLKGIRVVEKQHADTIRPSYHLSSGMMNPVAYSTAFKPYSKTFHTREGSKILDVSLQAAGDGAASIEIQRADKVSSKGYERVHLGDKAFLVKGGRRLLFLKGEYSVRIMGSPYQGKEWTKEKLVAVGRMVAKCL
jgi:hypothetical protein